ncbi:hypothetical protein IRP63_16320 [Clostridium phage CWou-2020a]|nr:hypothetical protein [Clostridium botulinum]QPW59432.1 hypothetical protein IRP63_16320 [Clostridium phage CWou-2020a]MCD3240902.1 hypothetical protein [Clostridium botulinum D/C]MCD3299803.1 hypothetical protein [Clostridium botulinum D/C]MCD3306457.1 hypothetical protein [Clostridium botulinum D/C]MCD3315932.1 hypothetical protein [Clostridium botulinum D/C]
MYWLIYYRTGRLERFKAKLFDAFEEIEMWVKEMGEDISVVDITKSVH